MSMSLKRRFGKPVCLSIVLIFMVSTIQAQTNTENFAQFQFNFNNPGARAAGIGGAFISIADDATAAEANPAGLTTLIRPEVSFEIKALQFTKEVTNFSHTGTAADYSLVSRDFENAVVSPSFASLVYPHQNLTFAAFRHELVNFESAFFTRGSFVPPLTDGSFFFPANSEIDLNIVNWGGALGIKLHEKLSVGISGGVSQIDLNSRLTRYDIEVFDEGTINNTAIIDDTGSDFFLNAGFIIKLAENFALGGIYKRRPEFTLDHTFTFTNFPSDFDTTQQVNFNVPSSFGVGLSFRPTDVLTFSFDAVRVLYSSLTEDFELTLTPQDLSENDFEVEDGMEFHFGVEYVTFLSSVGLVLRGGFYLEPDNSIRWIGDEFDSSDPNRIFSRQVQAALFQEGDDNFHYTFGLGVVPTQNFQVDVAGNLSNRSNELVASFVLRL